MTLKLKACNIAGGDEISNNDKLTFPLKEITGTTKRDLHLANLAFPISGFN